MASSYCGVFGCTNNSKRMPHLSYFSLPKDDQRRKKWIELMDRSDIPQMKIKNPRHLVCSEHFAKEMLRNKRLKPDAVPSLNLPGSKLPSCSTSSSKENVETQVDKPVICVIKQESSEEEAVDSEGPTSDETKGEHRYHSASLEYVQPSTSSSFIEEPRKKIKREPDTMAVGDEYDAIGINVAAKLRNLPNNMRILAEKLIGDVLFQAQTNGLTSASALVTPDPFS